MLLTHFLNNYSSFLLKLEEEKITDDDLMVLIAVQCRANIVISQGQASHLLLTTSVLVEGKYHYRLGTTQIGKEYFKNNYDSWYMKALIIAEKIPKRGDLLFPFLSYAIHNNKAEDAIKVCEWDIKGISGFCEIISAYHLLESKQINNQIIDKSIKLMKKAINKGLFNQMLPELYWKQGVDDLRFNLEYGMLGIPLSPDILYLIPEEEKDRLEIIIERTE